ncbi:MAG: LamG domain-containing protein [Candidatus Aenigmarchaeota archaeon]|nr:LamG domain-containing protein [Candidatus Aenigmarchaeota archaeon]
MKGLTPIIAVIVLLLVAIAFAGATYAYISIYYASLGKAVQVTTSYCDPDNNGAIVLLSAVGTKDVTISYSKAVPTDNNTLALWHLEDILPPEGSGEGLMLDSSGRFHNGTVNGGGMGNVGVEPAEVGNGYKFVGGFGITGWVLVPDHDDLDFNATENFSIEVRVKRRVTGNEGGILHKRFDATSGPGYTLNVSTSGQIQFSIYGPTGSAHLVQDSILKPDVFYPVMVQRDISNSRLNLYINGTLNKTMADTIAGQSLENSRALRIAVEDDVLYFYGGVLDEIRISNILRPPKVEDRWRCEVAGATAKCGEMTVFKTSGGLLDPFVDRSIIRRGETANFRDLACTPGERCDYRFSTAPIGAIPTSVNCQV